MLSNDVLGQSAAAQAIDPTQCAVDTTAPPAAESALDDLLASLIDPENPATDFFGLAPGAVILVEAPDWRYFKATGVADVASGRPLDCSMPFQIGSNTKTMTAVVLLQLHEEGLLDLDDPLSAHLPEVAAALPFGDVMTLHQLATHTSGVFSYTDNAPNGVPGIMEGALDDAALLSRGYRPGELVDFVAANGEPTFEPGSEGAWAYSNTGYVLLGLIVERATGEALADLYRTRIFEPLGMADSFLWNDVPEPSFGLPSSYFQAPFDLETTAWNLSQGWAAGAVISTAEDMSTFLRGLFSGALFRNGTTLDLMMDGVPLGNGQFLQYGVGLGEKLPGVWGHGGQTLGFESDTGYVLADDITIVIWTNAAQDLAAVGAQLVDQALIEAGVVMDPQQADIDAAQEALLEGEWRWLSTELVGEEGAVTVVTEPERYTLALADTGLFSIQADCNVGGGSYALDGYALSLDVGPITLAACPPESLADRYLELLTSVVRFSIEDGDLTVVALTKDGAEVLYFGRSDRAATPPADTADLVGIAWRWQEFQSMDDTTLVVQDPAAYTLRLDGEGGFNLEADCNLGGGTYSLEGSSLDLTVGPVTLAACLPDSLADRYLALLDDVVSYLIDDGDLYLSLRVDGGILRFAAP